MQVPSQTHSANRFALMRARIFFFRWSLVYICIGPDMRLEVPLAMLQTHGTVFSSGLQITQFTLQKDPLLSKVFAVIPA